MSMRVMIRDWIVCVGVAWTAVAAAAPKAGVPKAGAVAPKVSAQAQYQAAAAQYSSGNYQQALELIAQGLAAAPKDLNLLRLKGTVLIELRNYPEALATYEALLEAGVKGADRLRAQEIVKKLQAVRSTFLDITFTNGPATVYLDSKSLGAFCPAAATCNRALLPNEYTVIAERPGFDGWTDRVKIESGKTEKRTVTLLEKSSPFTVRVTPADARVTVDGADAPAKLKAGKHQVVVSLPRHLQEERAIEAHEGNPVELDIALTPLVPARVEPPGATLILDGGKPIAIHDGGLPVPPGDHDLVARAPGFDERQIKIPAERGADYEVVVKLAPTAAPLPPPRPSGPFTFRRKLALAAGGVGVVAAGAGVALGLRAKGLDDDAYDLCPSTSAPCPGALEANDLNERARSRALQANIAYGIAGGAAIAAAILWFTGAPESREPRVAVTPRLGPVAGIDLAVRF
jgi:hypothetical protein